MVAGQYITLFKMNFPVPPLTVDRREVVLKIWMGHLIVAKDKSPHLPDVRGANAGPGGQPLKTHTEFFERLCKGVQGNRFLAVKGTVDRLVAINFTAQIIVETRFEETFSEVDTVSIVTITNIWMVARWARIMG